MKPVASTRHIQASSCDASAKKRRRSTEAILQCFHFQSVKIATICLDGTFTRFSLAGAARQIGCHLQLHVQETNRRNLITYGGTEAMRCYLHSCSWACSLQKLDCMLVAWAAMQASHSALHAACECGKCWLLTYGSQTAR